MQELLRIPELPSALKKNSEKRFRSARVLTSEASLQQIEEKERKKREEEEARMRRRKEREERARQKAEERLSAKRKLEERRLENEQTRKQKEKTQLRPAKGTKRCKFRLADRKKRRHKVKLQRGVNQYASLAVVPTLELRSGCFVMTVKYGGTAYAQMSITKLPQRRTLYFTVCIAVTTFICKL